MGRLRPAEWVAALGGVLLLVSLWQPWYAVNLPIHVGGAVAHDLPTETAWQAFDVTDILLALYALLVLALVVVTAVARTPAKPVAFGVVASALGPLAILLVLVALVFQPGNDHFVEVRWGAWAGLGSVLIAWVGAWLGMRDETTPGAVAPDLPRRAAPPA